MEKENMSTLKSLKGTEEQAVQVSDTSIAKLALTSYSLLKLKRLIVVASIINLPIELKMMIFKLLDRVSSTCLGLTSKVLYAVHWKLRGKVPLAACCLLPPNKYSGIVLYELLEGWVGKDWWFSMSQGKFIASSKLGKDEGYMRSAELVSEKQELSWWFEEESERRVDIEEQAAIGLVAN